MSAIQNSGSGYKFRNKSMPLDIDRNALLAGHSGEFMVHSVPTSLTATGPVYLTRGSINSNTDSMSYFPEGRDLSFAGSVDSLASHPSVSVPIHVYGATALSPSGSESRVLLTDFDAFPVTMTCTECHQEVFTNVRYKSGKLAWIASGIIALFGCVFGCCLIPCCIKSFKDVVHECPNCKTALGTYRRQAGCMS